MVNNFRRVLEILGEVITEMFIMFINVVSTSIYPLSKILMFMLPYLMLWIGMTLYKVSGLGMKIEILILPILINLISYILKSSANKIGKGDTPPVPYKRFTSDDGDGEVSCEYDRLQEMLLFVNDYEKWLERKGLLRK